MYQGDGLRIAKNILRLHNCCFEHFVLLRKILPIKNLSDKMTRDRFFGKYQHNLCVHSPLQYRLVNGDTINCEDEERSFNLIKSITRGTSNYKPGHLIGNLVVRLEAESQSKKKYEFNSKTDSTLSSISDFGKKVENIQYNSLFIYDYIQKNSADWQAHLQRISDFLIFGENIWWKKTLFGIEFFDVDEPETIDQKPRVHHFRSSTIKSVANELEKHWSDIVDNNICIPTHEILLGDEDEKVVYKKTTFLSDKIGNFTQPDAVSLQTVHQLSINEELDEEDVTDFALDNVEMSDCANIEIISTSNSDSCASSSSGINLPSNSSTSSCNSNELSKEANAFFIVLGEISPMLQRYDSGLKVFKRLQKENLEASIPFRDHLFNLQNTLQQQVTIKLSELKSEFECWERSFLINNKWSAPTKCDLDGDSNITEINRKIDISNKILNDWNISFY